MDLIQNNTVLLNLNGGLRLVHQRIPGAEVDYFGVAVNAGSRDDPADAFGLAHFVEHTLFKGTSRRRSWHIINRMEACGGELNAYTTKESTTVYTVFPAGNLPRAVDLIGDLIVNSSFPKNEIDKEREVVADEINSYLDIPSEAVFDDFEDLLFAGSSLGHNILGTPEAIARIDSEQCRAYLRRLYFSANMVVFYSGDVAPDRVARLIERHFDGLPLSSHDIVRSSPQDLPVFDRTSELSIHQSHTVIGTRVCDMFSSSRYALSLLVNILGGPGMNSLLNVELREKRGLVYSVDASSALLTDTGIFTIYFGCDADDTIRCRQLISDVILRLADGYLTPARLAAALKQYLGQMAVAADNRENMIIAFARQALYRGSITPRSVVADRIRSLTIDDVRQAARMILPDRLSCLTLC